MNKEYNVDTRFKVPWSGVVGALLRKRKEEGWSPLKIQEKAGVSRGIVMRLMAESPVQPNDDLHERIFDFLADTPELKEVLSKAYDNGFVSFSVGDWKRIISGNGEKRDSQLDPEKSAPENRKEEGLQGLDLSCSAMLRMERKKRGIIQKKLAKMVGCSPAIISFAESDERSQEIDLVKWAKKIATVLGVENHQIWVRIVQKAQEEKGERIDQQQAGRAQKVENTQLRRQNTILKKKAGEDNSNSRKVEVIRSVLREIKSELNHSQADDLIDLIEIEEVEEKEVWPVEAENSAGKILDWKKKSEEKQELIAKMAEDLALARAAEKEASQRVNSLARQLKETADRLRKAEEELIEALSGGVHFKKMISDLRSLYEFYMSKKDEVAAMEVMEVLDRWKQEGKNKQQA